MNRSFSEQETAFPKGWRHDQRKQVEEGTGSPSNAALREGVSKYRERQADESGEAGRDREVLSGWWQERS